MQVPIQDNSFNSKHIEKKKNVSKNVVSTQFWVITKQHLKKLDFVHQNKNIQTLNMVLKICYTDYCDSKL